MPTINLTVNPPSQNITWQRGTAFPTLVDLGVSAAEDAFVDFQFNFENTTVNWLYLTGTDVMTDPNAIYFPPGSSATTVTPVLQNINLLTGNSYAGKIIFTRGSIQRTHTVNLTILGAYSAIKSEKDNYSVVYNRITDTLSGDTLVNILNNTTSANLSFETNGSLFLEKTVTNNFSLEEDSAFPFSTNTELPTTGNKIVSCRLKDSTGNIVYAFTVTITVINTNDITTDFPQVDFTIYKHLAETKTKVLQIINPANLDFTVTAPSFVTISPTSGNSSVYLTIETDNSATLLAQTYSGNVEIAYGTKVLIVPITVKNVDFLDFPVGDYNFCLDDFKLTAHRISDEAKLVRISPEIVMKTANGDFTVKPAYQIAYFEDKATTDLGRKIHNYFPIFDKPIFENSGADFDNRFIYNPAIVSVTVEELNADYEVVFTKTISDIKLFPGKKPKMFPAFTNSALKRIYSNTAHLFSYLTTEVQPIDIIGQNLSTNPFSPDEVHSVFFEDKDELMTFGDYKNVLGIDFMRMEKGDDQIFVQFINQNLVPELLIFNGFFQMNEEYNHNYEDAEGFVKKYSTSTIKKATLQTGYLFKDEALIVEELIKSVLAFIKIGDEIFEAFPITSKTTSRNSASNLQIFEIEFLIAIK